MEIHPTQKNEVAWSSWLPALGCALGNSHGPVLEIGIGHFSTPFLHEYCKGAGRELWSVESDITWRRHFEDRYLSDWHRFFYPIDHCVPKEMLNDTHFGVTFIDNSPGGEARLKPFKAALLNSDYIVVHDYWRENFDAIQPIVDAESMNFKVYSDYEPPTLLASKLHKL